MPRDEPVQPAVALDHRVLVGADPLRRVLLVLHLQVVRRSVVDRPGHLHDAVEQVVGGPARQAQQLVRRRRRGRVVPKRPDLLELHLRQVHASLDLLALAHEPVGLGERRSGSAVPGVDADQVPVGGHHLREQPVEQRGTVPAAPVLGKDLQVEPGQVEVVPLAGADVSQADDGVPVVREEVAARLAVPPVADLHRHPVLGERELPRCVDGVAHVLDAGRDPDGGGVVGRELPQVHGRSVPEPQPRRTRISVRGGACS